MNRKQAESKLAEMYHSAEIVRNKHAIPWAVNKIASSTLPFREVAQEIHPDLDWRVIAAICYREDHRLHENRYPHNGDPRFDSHGNPIPTRRVPKGVGPFPTWEIACLDAFTEVGGTRYAKHWDRFESWTLGETLYRIIGFNGRSRHYGRHGYKSPYAWAGTQHQRAGKFVEDGVYNPNVWDKQPGVAAILLRMNWMPRTAPPEPPIDVLSPAYYEAIGRELYAALEHAPGPKRLQALLNTCALDEPEDVLKIDGKIGDKSRAAWLEYIGPDCVRKPGGKWGL